MFKETCSYEAMPIEVNNLNPYLYGSLSDEVYDINKKGKQAVVKLDYGDSYAKEQSAFVKKACAGLCDMKELEKKMGEGTLPMLVNFMDSGNAYFVFCVKKGKLFYEFLSKRTGKVVSAVRTGGIPVKDNQISNSCYLFSKHYLHILHRKPHELGFLVFPEETLDGVKFFLKQTGIVSVRIALYLCY